MSELTGDTIAAVASGAGRAGIGVVRVSGDLVPQIAKAICLEPLEPRRAVYQPFVDEHHDTIDEGIALLFQSPHSFTGEHVLELQGHGGPVILDLILQRVLQLGARPAQPGEFSQRAFLNDKLDLAQAEAVDFSEEEIDFLAEPQLQNRATALRTRFDTLLAKAEQGQRLRDGLTIVIAGVANAGKSSLLNALAGNDSAIVTDIEGTTRDILREQISIEGVPLHIIDTAGLRETDDVVEREGIRRAREHMKSADHVLMLVDVSNPITQTVVLNKSDLVDNATLDSCCEKYNTQLSVSSKHGQGIEQLKNYLLSLAGHDSGIEGVYSARRRHIDALIQARSSTSNAIERLEKSDMPELAAEELRLAQLSLDEITGRFDSEDLLGRIFSSFCIGK